MLDCRSWRDVSKASAVPAGDLRERNLPLVKGKALRQTLSRAVKCEIDPTTGSQYGMPPRMSIGIDNAWLTERTPLSDRKFTEKLTVWES
jgi:hypothetical protein